MVDVVTWERRAKEQATNGNILAFYTLIHPSKAAIHSETNHPTIPGLR
jgi:hypothetical protein